MPEGFDVEPGHVSGYSGLAAVTANDCRSIGRYIMEHATSDENFGAVMDLLKAPVDSYAEMTDDRIGDRGLTLDYASGSLEDTAWTYHQAEGGNAERFRSFEVHGEDMPPRMVEQSLPGTVSYQPEQDIGGLLTAPDAPEEADVEALVEEYASDTVQTIDGIVRFVTDKCPGIDEWSPVEAIVNPLIGNWNALKQKGEAMVIAGEAAEAAAGNLTTGLTTLDGHWDGGAARSFDGYLGKLSAALDYEGALARVASQVYNGVAYLVEWIAIGAVKALSFGVEIIRRYTPGSGWVSVASDMFGSVLGGDNPLQELIDDAREAWHFFEDAMAIIEMLRELPGQIESLLGMLSDPLGALEQYGEDQLMEEIEPLREQLNAPELDIDPSEVPGELFEFGQDLAEVADTDTLHDAPTPEDPWAAGQNPTRAG
ncbi:hypothetical protein EV193_11779 [Herbihabitans rhizosphaerae]|uniref:WXG100 family type VII secretion target n=1 Tax=Herbihabitans rhizosphaerae TaxID=1872711 RepID=A0A4Q7KFE1_9PSEU|nr:hypothetical protein [Herbihabitans rhizosphaerae]RZS30381.1 hypothetical protein EV193_11779 [Herbihabitans rhizosphaerae]